MTHRPAASPHFIGRERELGELREASRAHRLVTVVAPGGMGKTTLCRKLEPDVWVDLTSATDAQGLERAFRRALDLRAADLRPVELLSTFNEDTLVVVDNAENVRTALLNVLTDPALKVAPARFIITSRIPLEVAGEHVLRLHGLSKAAAAELLMRDGGHLSKESAEELGERLSGVPLALALAARRVRMIGLGAFRDLLDAGEPVLRDPSRRDRHGNLHQVMEWTVQQLDPEERGFLTSLAVFTDAFGLEEAAAAAGTSPSVALDRVDLLTSRGLLQPTTTAGRFRMLVGVREAVLDESLPEAGNRLSIYLAKRAPIWLEKLRGPAPAQVRAAIRDSAESLIAGYRYAQSARDRVDIGLLLDVFHADVSSYATHEAFLEELVRVAEAGAGEERLGLALLARATFWFWRSKYAVALDELPRIRAVVEAARTNRLWTEWHVSASGIYRNAGRVDEATADAQRTIAVARDTGNDEWMMRGVFNLAGALAMDGRADASYERYLEALTWTQRLQQRRLEGLTLANLGYVDLSRGRFPEAIAWLTDAFGVLTEVDDRLMAAKIGANVMHLAIEQSDFDAARTWYGRVAETARRILDREALTHLALADAILAWHDGEGARARTRLDEARQRIAEQPTDCELSDILARYEARMASVESPTQVMLLGPVIIEKSGTFIMRDHDRAELAHRPSLRNILAALVSAHAESRARSVDELVSAGWPGERLQPEAAATRVYTAVRMLRRMGLDGVLVRRDGGYTLVG